jgi:hypothetical protein
MLKELFTTTKKGVSRMSQSIDVQNLPEEEVSLVREFVEFLRKRVEGKRSEADQEWSAVASRSFSQDWENKQDAVYDRWKELYHVPAR